MTRNEYDANAGLKAGVRPAYQLPPRRRGLRLVTVLKVVAIVVAIAAGVHFLGVL